MPTHNFTPIGRYEATPAQVGFSDIVMAETKLYAFCTSDLEIENSWDLANALQGISKAVSAVAISRSGAELHQNGGSYNQLDRVLVRPEGGAFGASVGNSNFLPTHQHTRYAIVLPTDRHIDALLTQEPCLWDDLSILAAVRMGSKSKVLYPFSNEQYTPDAPNRYFKILQNLTSVLIAMP